MNIYQMDGKLMLAHLLGSDKPIEVLQNVTWILSKKHRSRATGERIHDGKLLRSS